MPAPKRTIRLFVSSTFSDMKAERDLLQREVFPKLRQLCLANGLRFQAIDLRWGVNEEAGHQNRTIRICLRELARCQEGTLKPSFLVLLGDRYGWCPLPERIPADLFHRLKRLVTATDLEVASLLEWYRHDGNAVPPEFVLRPREGALKEPEAWHARVEAPLLDALTRAAALLRRDARLDEAKRRALEHVALGWSATHQEIMHGALTVSDAADHVHAFVRTIRYRNDEPLSPDLVDLLPSGETDPTARDRRDELRRIIQSSVGAANLHPYTVNWRPAARFTDADLEEFQAEVTAALETVIANQIRKIEAVPPDRREQEAHRDFGLESRDGFAGRTEELSKIASYLADSTRRPLAVVGGAGSGKSALVARAVQTARDRYRDDSVLILERYIGATPASSNIVKLLRDVVTILHNAYPARSPESPPAVVPSDMVGLATSFARALERVTPDRPLFLFLDGLDQLADHRAQRLYWLPPKIPVNVCIVVSVATPSEEGSGSQAWRALVQLVCAADRVTLPALDPAEAEPLLDRWLAAEGRTLQPEQKRKLLSRFQLDGNPLWLRTAVGEAARLSDRDTVDDFPAGTANLIRHVLRRLSAEENHGRTLVERAVSYLASSRYGLAEDEMLDALSRDAQVVADFRRRHPRSPDVGSLPVIAWASLRGDLDAYLTEHEDGGVSLIRFCHRSFADAVEEFCASRQHGHLHLAAYFQNRADPSDDGRWNAAYPRAISEHPYHLWQAGQGGQLARLLSDITYLDTWCRQLDIHDLIVMYAWLDDRDEPKREEWQAFLRKHAERLGKYPGLFFTLVHHEGSQTARAAAQQLVAEQRWSRPWVRTLRSWVPTDIKARTTDRLELLARGTVAPASVGGLAPDRGVAFFAETQEALSIVSLSDGHRMLGRIAIDPGSVLRVIATPDARYLTVWFDSGRAQLFHLCLDEEDEPTYQKQILSFDYLVPKFETPVGAFTKRGLLYQLDHEHLRLCVIDDAGEVGCRDLKLSDTLPLPELSGIAVLDGKIVASLRSMLDDRPRLTRSMLIDIHDAAIVARLDLGNVDVVALCSIDDSRVAAALTSYEMTVIDTDPVLRVLHTIPLKAVPVAMARLGDRLLWVSEDLTLHALPTDLRNEPYSLDAANVDLSGVTELSHLALDEFAVLSSGEVSRCRVVTTRARPSVRLTSLLDSSGGGAYGYYGLENRAEGVSLVDGCSRGQTCIATPGGHELLCALGSSGHALVANTTRGGLLVNLALGHVVPAPSIPEGVTSVARAETGGFWIAAGTRIFHCSLSGECAGSRRVNVDSVSGARIWSWPGLVIWTGLCQMSTRAGTEYVDVAFFYRPDPLVPGRLIEAGSRPFEPANGVLQTIAYDPTREQVVVLWSNGAQYTSSIKSGTPSQFVDRRETLRIVTGLVKSGESAVRDLRFSQDGSRLIALTEAGSLLWLDAESLEVVAAFAGSQPVTRIADSVRPSQAILVLEDDCQPLRCVLEARDVG